MTRRFFTASLRYAVAASLIMGVCAVANRAAANAPGPRARPAFATNVGGGETSLVVDRERLHIRCRASVMGPKCVFEATYFLRNPLDREATVETIFIGHRTSGVELSLEGDGWAHHLPASKFRREELIASVRERVQGLHQRRLDSQQESGGRPFQIDTDWVDYELVGRGIRLTVPEGGKSRLVMRGTMHPEFVEPGGYGIMPEKMRHPLLSGQTSTNRVHLEYLLAPIETWSGEPEVDVVLDVPSSWRVAAGTSRGSSPLGAFRSRYKWSVDPSTSPHLFVEMRLAEWPEGVPLRATFGGPVVGVGGYLDDARGVVVRAGLQGSFPPQVLHSIFVETDVDRRVSIAPNSQFALPGMAVIPSLGAGLGPVFQIAPRRRTGVRLQTSAHFPIAGLSTHVDWFPAYQRGHPRHVQVGMLLQLGL